jgi:TRAP-type uncharacterized transport system fused permease subunit
VHAARLGIVLYFIPIFFLFEPALILQGPLHLTAIWVTFNILAVVIIAGASEGRMMYLGRLKTWTRPILFAAGLCIGFPEWMSTVAGLAVTAGHPGVARARLGAGCRRGRPGTRRSRNRPPVHGRVSG